MNKGFKLAALVWLWCIPAAVFICASRHDWKSVWYAVGVKAMTPHFVDLRTIPAGVRTLQQGGDPLAANPFDPMQRPVNYPRFWLYLFSLLKLNDASVPFLALTFCFFYLLCISRLIAQAGSVVESSALLFAGVSSAAMFAMERGNIDLIVFAVVFLGCIFSGGRGAWAFMAATLLKIYPVAAMIVEAVRQQGRKRILPVVLLASVAVIFAIQWRDLVLIRKGTPIAWFASYGVISLREDLKILLMEHHFSDANTARGAALVMPIVWAACLSLMIWRWFRPRLDLALLQSETGRFFFVFGAIYAFSFAIGSNWDYRLIFLIPTLPFAFELLRLQRNLRWCLVYIPGLLLALNWIIWWNGNRLLLAHAVTTALFFLVLAVLAEQFRASLRAFAWQGKTQRPVTMLHRTGLSWPF